MLSCEEYGFMKGRCTDDPLAFPLSFIYDSVDKNQATALVFLDLAKAFDVA